MRAFVVTVNGKRLCTAGVGPNGVLSTIISWVGGGPNRDPEGDMNFHVGGLDSRTQEHVDWTTPELKVGDTVTVKIIETRRIDPESRRYIPDPANGGFPKKGTIRRPRKAKKGSGKKSKQKK